MVFLRSYCQQAICMATRASLLTGRRPDTTGITVDLGSYWRTRGGNFTSLPEHFRNQGYTTVGHGKSESASLDLASEAAARGAMPPP